jgi:hypothetical protein
MSFALLRLGAGTVLVSSMFISCGPQNTNQQNLLAQNDADTSAKMAALAPAEGDFSGSMTMASSQQNFDVDVQIKRVLENTHPESSTDPTVTAQVPKLAGGMHFPLIDQISATDFPFFSEMLQPMGGYQTVLFDFGDLDAATGALLLPYSVPGYSQGVFGELTGTLTGSQFSGTWFSKSFGTVGSFTLTKIATSKAGSSP